MASKDPAKPNILFLISDDTATQYLGCYGAAMLTPNLDAIAADGVRFTDAHVATPVCTPSRYTYQTGKYAHRGITPGGKESDPSDAIVQVGFNAKIKPGDPCLPTILKENGYKTGFVGKVHFGRGLGQLGCEPWPGDGDPHRPEVDAVMKKTSGSSSTKCTALDGTRPSRLPGATSTAPNSARHGIIIKNGSPLALLIFSINLKATNSPST